ncbi:unnamed protein product, partial [Prorocentrum cordatum]
APSLLLGALERQVVLLSRAAARHPPAPAAPAVECRRLSTGSGGSSGSAAAGREGGCRVPREARTAWAWEVQRRITLFHTDWRAPFLPHDGEARWRWLDAAYRRHPWVAGTLDASAAADRPPLRAPGSWACDDAGWVVATLGQPCGEGQAAASMGGWGGAEFSEPARGGGHEPPDALAPHGAGAHDEEGWQYAVDFYLSD